MEHEEIEEGDADEQEVDPDVVQEDHEVEQLRHDHESEAFEKDWSLALTVTMVSKEARCGGDGTAETVRRRRARTRPHNVSPDVLPTLSVLQSTYSYG